MVKATLALYAEEQHPVDEPQTGSNKNSDRNPVLWGAEDGEDDVAILPVLLLTVGVTALLTLVFTTGPHGPTVRAVSAIVLSVSIVAGIACYVFHRHEQ